MSLACTADDPHFKTAAIVPGKYTLLVEAWRKETPEEMHRTGIRLPAFNAIQKITIAADRDPQAVKLELKACPRK